MIVEVHQKEEISGGRKNGEGKVNFAVRGRRANRSSLNIKARERERVV